jgi:cell cycle sensor histidine kinase DivJ
MGSASGQQAWLKNVNILAPVGEYIDALVHPTARQDDLAAARHRAFIASRLLGSFAALVVFPIYLTLRGVPSTTEIVIVAWLTAPILIAYFLSRTGDYERACILSSLALAGLITTVALNTGGLTSFAAIWLVIVPLEAGLSSSRRVIAMAAAFALAATALLFALGQTELWPDIASGSSPWVTALGIVSAALCGTGIALAGEALARTRGMQGSESEGYQLLARHMTDVITRHGKNGAVLSISPAAERLLGVKMRDLFGHGLFDRVHVADRPAYLTALADAAADGITSTLEFRVRRGSADDARAPDFLWIEMRCSPIEPLADGVGGATEVVAVLRDAGERKTHEEALSDARAESESASAAKSRFVATMSHELRTPLNVIIGFSEMLADGAPSTLEPGKREEYARLINESGRHLLSIVNSILDMSKIEAGSFEITREPFALGPAVAGCCDLLALKASQAGLALERRIADGIPEIAADKRAVHQILINLLANAIKFTESGGCVSVKASRHGPWAVLEVIDTGVGVDAADLPRLGAPFFQARDTYDRKHEGTGLGLSIVKGLVELHGGELDIRSELGKGTHVTVRLPIDGQAVHEEAPRATSLRAALKTIPMDDRVKKIA